MDKEVKKRLRAAIKVEGISNLDIARKTGYTANMVSKSLNPKYDVLTQKFVNRFFVAFPEFAAKHKEEILNGTSSLFTTSKGLENLHKENEDLQKKLTTLEKTIEKMEREKAWLQSIIEKALQLHPDLVKLVSPFADERGENVTTNLVANFHEGTTKGAKRFAAA